MPEPIWKYEEYGDWARQLAKNHTRSELEARLGKNEGAVKGIMGSRLRAIEKSTSMQGNSQHRAQTGNVVRANYEENSALNRTTRRKPSHLAIARIMLRV